VSVPVPPSRNGNRVLTLKLSDVSLDVVLLRRTRKSIGIRIVEGRVEVAAHPRVPLAQLQQLLDQKRDWIAAHLQRQVQGIAARQAKPTSLLLAGSSLPLLHRPELASAVTLTPEGVLVGGGDDAIKPQLAQFLYQQAQQRFPERFKLLAAQACRRPERMLLSNARTRWGSCTQQGVIRLNWRLAQAPLAVLDYVIAHELAHLCHMNHSAAFWHETARLYPDWKAARAWLKQHGEALFVYA